MFASLVPARAATALERREFAPGLYGHAERFDNCNECLMALTTQSVATTALNAKSTAVIARVA
jgi:hypothetical protein